MKTRKNKIGWREGFQRQAFWWNRRGETSKIAELLFWGRFQKELKKETNPLPAKTKAPFCMLANNPQFYFCKAVFCWKHFKNCVFSRTQLLCILDSKNPFWEPAQNDTFQTKSAILGFPLCLLEPYFCSVWWFCMVTKKWHFPKTDSVNKNAFFCPSENK